MKTRSLFLLTIITGIFLLGAADSVRGQQPLGATTQQVRTLVSRIETNTRTFQNTIDQNTNNAWTRETRLTDLVSDFSGATRQLRSRIDARQNGGAEVSNMLNKALLIDQFINRQSVSSRTVTQWRVLRNDVDTLARYYRVSWNWSGAVDPQAGYPAYSSSDAQLRALISRIETKTNTYKRTMDNSLDRSIINGTNAEDSINSYISGFESATDRLKDRFDSRESTTSDATEVLDRARYIDQFMARNRMTRAAQNQWRSLRTELNTLAGYYRLSWNWNAQAPGYQGYSNSNIDARMTGTYRLNTGRSDNVANVINASLGGYANDQREYARRNLERRLTSPEMIAIERRNRTVGLASSNSSQVTFEADGVARSETNARGRTVTTTATANNSGISINYEGDRTNDFFVTFTPTGNGQLNVSRRLYLENQNEMITVSSVYDKIANAPQWSTVNSGQIGSNTGSGTDFYIANGTVITATLRDTIGTRTSKAGDRFALEVTSPGQYRGAVIEGSVTEASNSGRFSGRANLSIDLDTIRFNGNAYRYAGILESVTAANGDNVSVNNEGTVRDSSQTTQTATRAGIGAVLGAIIGAIAGGGQGAAIGAGVGAGAGAGTVLITGRDSIELGPGTVFNITSTAPANIGPGR